MFKNIELNHSYKEIKCSRLLNNRIPPESPLARCTTKVALYYDATLISCLSLSYFTYSSIGMACESNQKLLTTIPRSV